MHTIIIPIYNAEKSIQQCIDSILVQNNRDFELILINDGSTDNSGIICENYAKIDSRIKVFHKSNGGVSSARNIGLDNAKGEWITFIDADDYIEQNYLPSNLENSDLIIYNWTATNKMDNKETIPPQYINISNTKSFLEEHLWKTVFRSPWGKIYKNDIIKENKIRFNPKYKIGEDTLFVLQYLFFCQNMRVLSTSTYKYTINENNKYKYKQDVNISLSYLKDFWQHYKRLKCNNKKLLRLIYNFYYSITYNIKDKTIYNKWINDSYVILLLHELYYKEGIKNQFTYLKLLIKSLLYKTFNNKV